MKSISAYTFEKPVSCGEFCEFLSEVLKISPESYLTFTPDIQYYDTEEFFGVESLRGPFVQLYFNEEIYSSGPMFLSSLYTALIQNYKSSDILNPYYKPVRAKARSLPTPEINIIEL
jgi:hypothetical protein